MWWSHDKQLCSSFMDCPFIIDPDYITYCHQFKCTRLDSWTNLPGHHSLCLHSSCAASSNDNCYAPYEKPEKPGASYPVHSFQDPKNTLCLRCGSLGHCANTCHSPLNCHNHPNWKNGQLINKASMLIYIIFNVKGTCSDSAPTHGTHSCSLCSDSTHGATGCP